MRSETFNLIPLAPPERHFWTSGFAERITIDQEGIRIDYANSKMRILRWDDPDLEFGLIDRRTWAGGDGRTVGTPPAQGREFQMFPGSWGSLSRASPIWISREAFRALRGAGIAARLHVFAGDFDRRSSLIPFWANVTGFTRKPPGFLQVESKDPPASP
jgi:hypothetical protein